MSHRPPEVSFSHWQKTNKMSLSLRLPHQRDSETRVTAPRAPAPGGRVSSGNTESPVLSECCPHTSSGPTPLTRASGPRPLPASLRHCLCQTALPAVGPARLPADSRAPTAPGPHRSLPLPCGSSRPPPQGLWWPVLVRGPLWVRGPPLQGRWSSEAPPQAAPGASAGPPR